MKTLAILLLTCAALPAMAATYRWVDENGVVHYSDKPRADATEITVPTAQTYSATTPRAAQPAPGARTEDTAATSAVYQSLRVVRPAPQESYRNIGGELLVSLSLSPALKPGHKVRVMYDGQPLSTWPEGLLSSTITGIYRGEHNLRAEVVDANGKTLVSSDMVTFFVHQTSIFNRARN